MKAIIMAGGEGSRLRPLTCDCPKPMMKLMDKPVMEYALELLRTHGITQVTATLGYLPDAVTDYFGDGTDFDLSLNYTIEKTPLGTAGGVKQAKNFLDETFIVLSGDGITDLDINDAVNFHREKGALATLVLRHEPNPLEYGVVSTDSTGRVSGFIEKPCRSDAISDTINTGIYILEPKILDHIPDGRPYDFGHDLFPKLVREGARVFAYVMDGYWCDIGDVHAYLAAHIDAMEGRIHLPSLLHARSVRMPSADVHPSAVLEPPYWIGPGAQIRAGARIGAYSVIGENCIVGENASVKRAILWPGAHIAPRGQARACILATNAQLGEGAQAYEESILGTAACAAERAVILPGVKIWPNQSAAPGERIDENVIWGTRRCEGIAAGVFPLASPAQATRAAQACAAVLHPQELLLARTASTIAAALWHATAAGAMAQGIQVLDAGICTLPQLRDLQRTLHCDAAALICDDRMIPLNEHGVQLSSKQQRAINTMNTRHDYAGPFSGVTHNVLPTGQTEFSYIAASAANFIADPHFAPQIALHAQSPHLLSLAERAFIRAGLNARIEWENERMELAHDELGIWLDNWGESAIFANDTGMLNEAEQQLLRAWTALECGEQTLILPIYATRAIDALAASYEARTRYIPGEPSKWMNALSEQSPLQFRLWFDGIQSALLTLSTLVETNLDLATWRTSMPQVHRRNRIVQVPSNDTGRILHEFAEREFHPEVGGGLRFQRDDGWAWICPDELRPEFRIITESANAEFAKELCDFCESRLMGVTASSGSGDSVP